MPKVIPNLREKLLFGAKELIEERGYSDLTVRSVASYVGVGVGTLYNHFKSKDGLVSAFMLADWEEKVLKIEKSISENSTPKNVIFSICASIKEYIDEHSRIFSDSEAIRAFAKINAERSDMLIGKVASYILPYAKSSDEVSAQLLSEFIAQSIFDWGVAGKSADELYPIFKMLMK